MSKRAVGTHAYEHKARESLGIRESEELHVKARSGDDRLLVVESSDIARHAALMPLGAAHFLFCRVGLQDARESLPQTDGTLTLMIPWYLLCT